MKYIDLIDKLVAYGLSFKSAYYYTIKTYKPSKCSIEFIKAHYNM